MRRAGGSRMISRQLLARIAWALPWLVRYPLWRAREIVRREVETSHPCHLIYVVANHFEPSWEKNGIQVGYERQLSRLDNWCKQARAIGKAVRDCDGTPFRHTYFYPAEQYYPPLLERLSELQAEGLGEVEVHLHHGADRPDSAANLRRTLASFRDVLAEKHRCLSRWEGVGPPMYAFVHGNWALANSGGGRFCGVDSEMQILAETGCYADLTLPSAPDRSQVPRINAIYQCGRPLTERSPHYSGPDLRVGHAPRLPVLLSGPLILYWKRGSRGLPVLGVENGSLAANYPLDLERLRRWRSARVCVRGRPEWVFIKLTCHGFPSSDQGQMIGEPMRRFLEDVVELGEQTGQFRVHFATAREAFNMAMAAVDGHGGEPGRYRNHRLRLIMHEGRGSLGAEGEPSAGRAST